MTLDDPFFATLRQRHPEVDVVLLPPEAPPPDPDPGAAHLVRTDLETVRTHAEELGVRAEERVELGDLPGTAHATARSITTTGETSVVDGLAAAAADHGWSLQRRPGPVDLLLGTRDGSRLRVSHAPTTGVLIVEVSAPDRPVGRELARELVGGAR